MEGDGDPEGAADPEGEADALGLGLALVPGMEVTFDPISDTVGDGSAEMPGLFVAAVVPVFSGLLVKMRTIVATTRTASNRTPTISLALAFSVSSACFPRLFRRAPQ
jgi:hypothetical protein